MVQLRNNRTKYSFKPNAEQQIHCSAQCCNHRNTPSHPYSKTHFLCNESVSVSCHLSYFLYHWAQMCSVVLPLCMFRLLTFFDSGPLARKCSLQDIVALKHLLRIIYHTVSQTAARRSEWQRQTASGGDRRMENEKVLERWMATQEKWRQWEKIRGG